jgi:hypothetical protein
MSTAVMERIAEASPSLKARIAGAFNLLAMLMGMFALVRRSRQVSMNVKRRNE